MLVFLSLLPLARAGAVAAQRLAQLANGSQT